MAAVTITGFSDITPTSKGKITLTNTSAIAVCVLTGNPYTSNVNVVTVSLQSYIVPAGGVKVFQTPAKTISGMYLGHDEQKIFAAPVGVGTATVDIV